MSKKFEIADWLMLTALPPLPILTTPMLASLQCGRSAAPHMPMCQTTATADPALLRHAFAHRNHYAQLGCGMSSFRAIAAEPC